MSWCGMFGIMFGPVFGEDVIVDVRNVVTIGWLANATCSWAILLHKLAIHGAFSLLRPSRALLCLISAQIILHLTLLTRFCTMDMHEANVLVALALTSPEPA